MKYTLSQVIESDELKHLCESFSKINGTVTAITDLEGNVLISSGWQTICTHFHRIHPVTRKRCNESDTLLAGRLKEGKKYSMYQCKNGLIDVAVPIMIDNEHVGNFFTGQFFTKKPDPEHFRKQAKQFDFDEKNYLTALESVPVLGEDQIKKNAEFLVNLTEIIGKNALQNLIIQEQKEKAEESERKLRTISKNMLDLAAVTDLRGHFKFVGASHEILGYELESLIGKNIMDFVHPDDLPKVQADFMSFLENRADKAESTYRYLCADGSYLWLESFGTFIVDKQNDPVEIIFNTRDITERKQTEQALKESERKFRSLVETLGEGVGIVDENENFIFTNRAANQIFQTDKNELTGKQLFNYITQESKKKIIRETLKRKQGLQSVYELEIITKKNEKRYISVTATPYISFNNDFIGTIGVFRDITEIHINQEIIQQQYTQLQKLNTDKDRFFSILSHDLRSPFNLLLGFSGVLLNNLHKYDMQKIEKQIEIIHKTTHQTYHLLEQILLWSKSQSGKLVIKPEKINFPEVTNELINNFKSQADEKAIKINLPGSEKIILIGDLHIYTAIMRNLISNAVKFTPRNGEIDIFAEKKSKNYTITVSDNGIGIDEEIIPKLWGINDSYSTAGTNNEQGTGFGLSLCKELIEKHGGRIWVESKPNKGSDFKFTIPLK
jgi:PAS domain S-box-containing protein